MQKLLTFETLVLLGYVNNRVTLTRRVRRGEFPAPIRLGVRNVAWIKAEIDAWEQARCAERGARQTFVKAPIASLAPRPRGRAAADRGNAGGAELEVVSDTGADATRDTIADTS